MAEYHVGNGLAGIYAGTLDKSGSMWRNKSNVTDEAIAAVFSWFADHMPKILELDESAEYSITYSSSEYELVMRRKSKETNEGSVNDELSET